ncbi:transglycosylase SLT domain-containing protein [Alkalilacustris brevis]|uniref:transglycosylase SLT domain-containing protein n=1 Tax=Alkalilacustris brevis TaxID=2026338 RepID=UPI00138FE666|nr:transglycosylase SLT domain-containing protein [Alkalilacustris brevis]
MKRKPFTLAAAFGLALTVVTACASPEASRGVTDTVPVTQWDHRPEAQEWTVSTMSAIAGHGRPLIETPLADIDVFCPGYENATEEARQAFWVGLFSGLAKYESTWNPRAAGAGGRYRGLLQIWPTTARNHGCRINEAGELYEGPKNLSCAVRIAAAAVERDRVVAGGPGNWGGVAADWPPLRDAAKRAEIAGFTRSQSYCQG